MIFYNNFEDSDLILNVINFNCDNFDDENIFIPNLIKKCKRDIKIYITKKIRIFPNKLNALVSSKHHYTYYFIKELKRFYRFNRIIMFDAHPDLNVIEYLDESSFLYYLLEEGLIKKVLLIGISNPGINELEYIEKKKIKYFSSLDVYINKKKIIKELRNFSEENYYLSIDLDVLNLPIANWKEYFGINLLDLIYLLRNLSNKLIAFDVMELQDCKYMKLLIKLIKEICCLKY